MNKEKMIEHNSLGGATMSTRELIRNLITELVALSLIGAFLYGGIILAMHIPEIVDYFTEVL